MAERTRKLNDAPFREKADWVLYWSQMNRRARSNHAFEFAIELANERGLPVLFYEGLTCTYPYANDRLHTFLLEGVPDTERDARARGAGYAFYLRKRKSDPNAVVYDLAKRAAAVVTDDYPTFIAKDHNSRVPSRMDVAYFATDSSCVVPMSHFEKRQHAAYTIRPKIHKVLSEYLKPAPNRKVKCPWTAETPRFHVSVERGNIAELVASCEIDHNVAPSTLFRGGSDAAHEHLSAFLKKQLAHYPEGRNRPSEHATSLMSPYLHFGHISSLEIALETNKYAAKHEISAEAYLEELIVRRELSFNFARFASDYESFHDLPDWAKKTMTAHAHDRRDPVFTAEQMERAETYDPLWNATQKELLLRGKIHGYYRMYWGKKMMEWSPTYQDALDLMIRLHDRYALDGRDPNTYTNILWCFGLHDRPWFERPIFGLMRYLSFDGMKRKTNVEAYVREIAELEKTGTEAP